MVFGSQAEKEKIGWRVGQQTGITGVFGASLDLI